MSFSEQAQNQFVLIQNAVWNKSQLGGRFALFNADGTPFDFSGGGGVDVADGRFRAVSGGSATHKDMRTPSADVDEFNVYSGAWARVPESAAEEEGDWYVGALRPPGPGIYLFVGFVDFFDNSFQSVSVKATIQSEGSSTGVSITCYNGHGPAGGGLSPIDYKGYFSFVMKIPSAGDKYVYADLETDSPTAFADIIPHIAFTAVRLVALS